MTTRRSRTSSGRRTPFGKSTEPVSYLIEENKSMDRRRRLEEQNILRKLARVNAREHADEPTSRPSEEAELNGILPHPALNQKNRWSRS